MSFFLIIFWIWISLYHIITTIIGYWLFNWEIIQTIALTKEAIRIIAISIFFILKIKYRKDYFKTWKRPWIIFLTILLFAISMSLLQERSIYNIFIWLKYNFHFIVVFLTSTIVWYLLPKTISNRHSKKVINILQYSLITIVIVWFLRQISKFINPIFFQKIWYWAIWDFVFWKNPPIYYRTWPWGIARWQWIFSWPNNYWYFLTAFLPLIFFRRKPKIKKIKELINLNPQKILHISFILIWITAIILTLSRSAILGSIIAMIAIHKDKIKWNKKSAISIWVISILAIWWLSILKWWSTIEHISSKLNGVLSINKAPIWWLWLGTAWPAIHHWWNILPENYYLQVILDIWTFGFLLRTLLRISIIKIHKKIYLFFKTNKSNETQQIAYLHRNYINIWFMCLLILGFLLHVFEDSMVNFLFFIPFGILSWYLSKQTKNNNKPKIS